MTLQFKHFLFLLLLLPLLGIAQEEKDLKIGMVFSGGGAKCLAQIGALRVIEECGLEIDYVSGTSMGAIIGALYSLGYSVDEIEAYMKKVDWDALLSNEIPRNRLTYFDRKAEDRYLLTFPIVNNKPQLPSGINYAQYILKQLSYLTQKSSQYSSFSEFPIPFLCVATDLENGELEIFENGRLIDALRASSSFPSLFTPYLHNNKLYVDGGVANNFPAIPLKNRGMEYIIGVDVQDFLYTKDELTSVVRVLEQTSSFLKANENIKQMDSIDLVIKPIIPNAGITSFELFDSIVAQGERAARLHIKEIKRLAATQRSRKKKSLNIDHLPLENFLAKKISIEGNDNSSRTFILGKLRIEEGELISIKKLDNGLDRLYGSKYFENVDYTLNPLDSGYHLIVRVRESNSLSQFRLGLHYDDDYKTALLLNYTQRNLLFKNSRLSVDLALGDNPRINFDYFIDRGLLPTLGFKFRSNRFETRIYDDSRNPINELTYLDYSVDFFVQSTFKDAYAIGAGVQLEGLDLSQNLSVLEEDNLNSDYINYYGFIDFDSFNKSNYPTRGFKFRAMARIIAAQENLSLFFVPTSVVDVTYSQVIPVNSKLNLIATLFGGSIIGRDVQYPYNIFFGSMGRNYINYIKPFVGYRYMELQGRSGAYFKLDVNYQFLKNHYFIARGNVGKLEKTSFGELFGTDILLDGYCLGYSYDSPIGPLELNLSGSTNHSDIYTYISLGFWF